MTPLAPAATGPEAQSPSWHAALTLVPVARRALNIAVAVYRG